MMGRTRGTGRGRGRGTAGTSRAPSPVLTGEGNHRISEYFENYSHLAACSDFSTTSDSSTANTTATEYCAGESYPGVKSSISTTSSTPSIDTLSCLTDVSLDTHTGLSDLEEALRSETLVPSSQYEISDLWNPEPPIAGDFIVPGPIPTPVEAVSRAGAPPVNDLEGPPPPPPPPPPPEQKKKRVYKRRKPAGEGEEEEGKPPKQKRQAKGKQVSVDIAAARDATETGRVSPLTPLLGLTSLDWPKWMANDSKPEPAKIYYVDGPPSRCTVEVYTHPDPVGVSGFFFFLL